MYIPYTLGYKVKIMTLEKVEIFKYLEEITLYLHPPPPLPHQIILDRYFRGHYITTLCVWRVRGGW